MKNKNILKLAAVAVIAAVIAVVVTVFVTGNSGPSNYDICKAQATKVVQNAIDNPDAPTPPPSAACESLTLAQQKQILREVLSQAIEQYTGN